jgi:hypothetical protein
MPAGLMTGFGGCAEAPRARTQDSSAVSPRSYREAWDHAVEAYGKGRYARASSLLDKLPEGDTLLE